MSVRLAVLSDLHLEAGPWRPPPFEADVVILAGDIAHGTDGVSWAAATFPGTPVLYIAGNHEHWGEDAAGALAALRRAAAATANVRFLENDEVILDLGGRRLRFLACTLWTDAALPGAGSPAEIRAHLAELAPDYRNMRVCGRSLRPEDVLGWHARSRAWLDERLAAGEGRETVVLTHHAPSALSLAEAKRARPAAAGAASDLEALIRRHRPALWIHGHTHHPADYRIGATRVVCNPRAGQGEGQPYAPLLVDLPSARSSATSWGKAALDGAVTAR